MKIIKRSGMEDTFDIKKIEAAIRKANESVIDYEKLTEEKIQEIRLVNRAKWALIQCLGMSETEAHRYLEKQAMDHRISKREAALQVLATYRIQET